MVGGSDLAAALDQVPDIGDGSVFFTDWSMLGHQNTTSFAGALVSFDDQMQRDLGIRSTGARWELDLQRLRRPPVQVLSYDVRTDLSGLAAKLTRLGYRAHGSILTGPMSQEHPWTIPLRTIGIDPGRHLLVGSSDPTAVRPLLAVPPHPLGHAEPVVPLLAYLAARQAHTATAAIAVGSAACVPLTAIIGRGNANPTVLAAVRRHFPGTFTPPQAEITALATATDTTALEALTFPDHHTAQANQAGRSAASQTLSGIAFGDTNQVRATGSAVTGRVLSFDLTAKQPNAVPHRVISSTLGVDLCP